MLIAEESFDLSAIAGVNAELGESLAHTLFRDLESRVKELPELILKRLGGLIVKLEGAESKSIPDTVGGFETFVSFEVVKFALTGKDEQVK